VSDINLLVPNNAVNKSNTLALFFLLEEADRYQASDIAVLSVYRSVCLCVCVFPFARSAFEPDQYL
jgi:hypothetical protein